MGILPVKLLAPAVLLKWIHLSVVMVFLSYDTDLDSREIKLMNTIMMGENWSGMG